LNDRPLKYHSRLGPLVRGLIRSPASRNSGWASSAIGGKAGGSMSTIHA
jgi:hypothetical protein